MMTKKIMKDQQPNNISMIAWDPAISNLHQAFVMPPQLASIIMKKSKRPLLVTGSLLLNFPDVVKRIEEIVKRGKMTIAATGGSSLVLKNNLKFNIIGLIQLINNLKDPEWEGFDGKGNYDVICFIGVPYYIASQGLSTLKNFAPHNKTLTICKFMHPNADMSYPNLKHEEWIEWLDKLIKNL